MSGLTNSRTRRSVIYVRDDAQVSVHLALDIGCRDNAPAMEIDERLIRGPVSDTVSRRRAAAATVYRSALLSSRRVDDADAGSFGLRVRRQDSLWL